MRKGAIETQLGREGSFGTAARNGTLHHGAIAVVAAAGAPFPTQHSVPAAGQLCRTGLATR